VSKTIGNRQKPGWQRVRKAEADHQKRLLKKFQDQKRIVWRPQRKVRKPAGHCLIALAEIDWRPDSAAGIQLDFNPCFCYTYSS